MCLGDIIFYDIVYLNTIQTYRLNFGTLRTTYQVHKIIIMSECVFCDVYFVTKYYIINIKIIASYFYLFDFTVYF